MDRSFDVLDKSAQNENGLVGNLMGAGIGLGVGLGAGNQMGNISGALNTNIPPSPISSIEYFILINNQQNGPLNLNKLKELIINEIINKDTLVWKSGMANWEFAGKQIALVSLFNSTPPPPPAI